MKFQIRESRDAYALEIVVDGKITRTFYTSDDLTRDWQQNGTPTTDKSGF